MIWNFLLVADRIWMISGLYPLITYLNLKEFNQVIEKSNNNPHYISQLMNISGNMFGENYFEDFLKKKMVKLRCYYYVMY